MDHLVLHWGRAVALAFHDEVQRTIGLLSVLPSGGVMEFQPFGIRSIPVARQVRLFYRVDSGRLILLVFLDVRGELFQRVRME